ncbi:MAG: thioredoxin domain-containing protein [Gemmatimonadaceae bacterium]
MPNRLAAETSPYLQQHADNPVDWHPWGTAAFDLARASNRPVLLSIGYAACHWCHVMAHESFEDSATARLMNDLFVNVKVDREERPDVDSIYMQAVQAISGHGGWPMTVFLTPDGVPFFGGTYFPPDDRHGLPSFRRILGSVSDAWRTKRDEVLTGAESLRGIYAAASAPTAAGHPLTGTQWRDAVTALGQWYDAREGGFGGAPKFPQPQLLDTLLRHWARTGDERSLTMVRHSFARMAGGGLHDQVGGGFHRYTVDGIWLVPHFEKMLYDNALLARLAVHLWQATGDADARRVALDTFAWVRREMTHPGGGWFASLDADSEGHEGLFYVWTERAFRDAAGDDADLAGRHWGVTPAGNFEGANIPHVSVPIAELAAETGRTEEDVRATIARARHRLLAARASRTRPARDEKILASWNGLMLRAIAEGARAFGDAVLADAAVAAGTFLRRALVRDGRALRSWRDGEVRIPGFLEDHAALGLGFLSLYQLTFGRAWLDEALALDAQCVRWFWSDEVGAFFDTAHDAEPLVTRPRDVADNAIPSGTSLAVELQLAASVLTGDDARRRRAEYVIGTLAPALQRSPLAFGHLLGAADLAVHGAIELAIAGNPADGAFRALAQAAAGVYVPSVVIAGGQGDDRKGLPLLEHRAAARGGALAFVCRSYSCDVPASDPAILRSQLLGARSAPAAP